MHGLEAYLVSRFMIFTLVLARTGALVMTAPLIGSLAMPRQARAFLAVAMSLVVTPVYLGTSLPSVQSLPEYARLFANEVLVGLLLGLGLNILFSGIQVAGQIVSQMSGLSVSGVFNPSLEEDVSVFSHLFYFLMLAVFIAMGGHREMIDALLQTFTWSPPGHAALGTSFIDVLVSVTTQSFALGIRAAAPLLIALLLATIVLGLVSRTLPQINIIAVGFGLNSLLTLGLLCLSIGAVAWTFQNPTTDILLELQEAVGFR